MKPDLDNWHLFYYFLPVTLNPYFGNWHLFHYILHIVFNPIRPRKSSPNHSFSPKKSRFAFQTEMGEIEIIIVFCIFTKIINEYYGKVTSNVKV